MKNATTDNEMTSARWPDAAVVFFDGGCPLCSREIAHYRRLRGAGSLCWVDISTDDAALKFFGIDREAAMARFHVLDRRGYWQTGAWGFAELWSNLPAYRWLSVALRKLHLVSMLDKAYVRFARWRLGRMCTNGACNLGAR